MPRAAPLHRLTAILILAMAALACAGCDPGARLHGQWEVDAAGLKSSQPQAADNPLAGLAANMLSLVQFQLEFKADGTCSATMGMLGQSKTVGGKWRFVKQDGDTITIAVKMEDSSAEREVSVKFADNDHLEMVPPVDSPGAAAGKTLSFVRVKPK